MAKKSLRWKNGSPTRRMNNKLRRFEKILNVEMFSAVKSSTEIVRDTAVGQAYPAKNHRDGYAVGRTDSHTGRRISSKGSARRVVTRKYLRKDLTGQVRVKPHYTGARTRAIKSLYTKYGRRAELTRKGLKVRRPWLKQKRARFIGFSEDRSLKKWAIKNKMIGTQKVLLNDGRIVRDLMLRPSLKRNESFMRRLFRSGWVRAGLRIKA